MPSRSEIIRAKRKAIGGKRPRCNKGTSCSAACINRNKKCLVNAPTPVADSIPRAIKAIQTRKERLGPRERRQASQKRRAYVKSKVEESAKLREERSKFNRERNSLIVKWKLAVFRQSGHREVSELEEKIRKLDAETGTRLGVRAASLDRPGLAERLRSAQLSFALKMAGLRNRLRQAASGSRPNRQLYEELERKILAFSKKDIPLWRHNNRPMRESERGLIWKQAETERRNNRISKYSAAYSKLADQAKQAAKEGNLKKYREIEAKLLKISEKAGSKLGREKLEKGALWKDARVPEALKKIVKSIEDALEAGDLSRYKALESKFLRAKDAYVRGDVKRKDALWSSIGSKAFSGKGDMLESHLDILKNNLKREAYKGNRREYNKHEENLLKLDPSETKGRLWKERVKEKVEEYLVGVGRSIDKAIRDGDKKEYNKLERIFMRTNGRLKKGQMWREGRIKQYVPGLMSKMGSAAASGDRKAYNKLEKTLLRINPSLLPGGKYEKGRIWAVERGNLAVGKLREGMENAARANDKGKYDKLEASFLRLRKKMGESYVRDTDMRWMSRGDLWREVRGNTALFDMTDSLNKGRGENVERITFSGHPGNFTLSSRILGNTVELHISPNDSTSFTVNGSYTADPNMPRRESFAITREVMRQYGEVMTKMEDGTVFRVSAASGDGRKDMREKAYVGFNFSEPDHNGYMYGMVKGGKMTPIDENEYYDNQAY